MPALRSVLAPTAADLDAAAEVVARHLLPTPVLATDLGGGGWLKAEIAQPTGSFKVRGALAALAATPSDTRLLTCSAGNHGLGMAYAATTLGRSLTVVVPRTASPAKVAALRGWPIELVEYGASYDEAETYTLGLAADGARYVSPYNDPIVIAGQASMGRELAAQLTGPLTVVCPIGGGGLCAGLALWAAGRDDIRVVGVEATASAAVSAAITAGGIVPIEVGPTLADGLGGNLEAGAVTPAVIGEHADAVTAVNEAEIRSAIRWLFSAHGLVVEGAGAVGVAALRAGRVDVVGTPVAVLSGRNITADRYREVLAAG